ncbi:MAG: methionine adenosyltransferase [Propionibacteriaceae bacterium]|jgi:S-adenosylmethionine synthetase|nr:methionine adenosyltransferase [Propionibacteriaceae bacterium]
MPRLFTSESVTEGHPDKVADAISDGVVDALLARDRSARAAVETMVAKGVVIVSGEVTTSAYVDIEDIARQVVTTIGYRSTESGLDGSSCGVLLGIGAQSPDIAQGVDQAEEFRQGSTDNYDLQGAGDQGMMFGYACDETENLMPLPIDLAHRLSQRLAAVRHNGQLDYLFPDGKTQATIKYDEAGRPVAVNTVVVSAQHHDRVSLDQVRRDIVTDVIEPVVERYRLATSDMVVHVNPTGRFVVGGPAGDVGLTGRKTIVDTYGGMARHGGGAFSGKDPSKVDRSAAYALRWVAKNVVAAGLARRCEVQVAYAIGRAHPIGLHVDCFGTAQVPVAQIRQAIEQVFDLRPRAIIDQLNLLRPIYSQVTNYGHFGQPVATATWEQTDRAEALAAAVTG